MYNINAVSSADNDIVNAPFNGYGKGSKSRLIRLGVIKDNETPNDMVISFISRTHAVNLTDSFIYDFDNGDCELLFIHEVLNGLLEKNEINAMYLYIATYSISSMKYVPRELVQIACREDLLNLYIKHFMNEYEKLVYNYEGDSEINCGTNE